MSNPPSGYTPRPMSSRTTYALGAVAVVLVALIVVFAYRSGSGGGEVRNDGYGTVRNEAVVSAVEDNGAVLLGRPDAAKTLEVFEDAICPGCGSLEHLYGQEIAQKIDEGKLAVRYRFVNALDAQSDTGDYSSRAIAALHCVADTGSGITFAKFHDTLLTDRRPDEGASLDDQELLDLATESGADDTARNCVTAAHHEAAHTDGAAALDDLKARLGDEAATPAVFDADTKIDVNESDWVQQLAP